MLSQLHTISGILIILFFIGKVSLHYILEKKINSNISFLYSLTFPGQYIRFHTRPVEAKCRDTQKLCNLLLILALTALILNVVVGVAD